MDPTIAFILKTFWFILPAGIANMTPVLVKKINFLNTPMDFGKSWQGKRIFGAHKTWRGLFFGTLTAIVIVQLQATLFPKITLQALHLLRKEGAAFLAMPLFTFIGFLLGFGALAGDAIKSFFKRRANVKPGKQWVPWDQLDWIIGALVAVHFFYMPLSLEMWVTALLLFGLLHPVINLVGYYLGIKKNKF